MCVKPINSIRGLVKISKCKEGFAKATLEEYKLLRMAHRRPDEVFLVAAMTKSLCPYTLKKLAYMVVVLGRHRDYNSLRFKAK